MQKDQTQKLNEKRDGKPTSIERSLIYKLRGKTIWLNCLVYETRPVNIEEFVNKLLNNWKVIDTFNDKTILGITKYHQKYLY